MLPKRAMVIKRTAIPMLTYAVVDSDIVAGEMSLVRNERWFIEEPLNWVTGPRVILSGDLEVCDFIELIRISLSVFLKATTSRKVSWIELLLKRFYLSSALLNAEIEYGFQHVLMHQNVAAPTILLQLHKLGAKLLTSCTTPFGDRDLVQWAYKTEHTMLI